MNLDHIDVLLVEDETTFARLIQYSLNSQGVKVHCVRSVKEALNFIAQEKTDVILLDLGLPDSNGLETLKIIYEGSKHTPILVLTGLSDMDMALEAVEIGAQDWLIKGETDTHLMKDMIFSIARCKRCEAKKLKLQESIRCAMEKIHSEICH